jgi:hypothetical protein
MKAILIAALFLASSIAHAQKSCDDLMGQAKESCLKQGGTVKANSAAGGSSARKDTAKDPNWPKKPKRLSSERYAEPGAPTDYTKPDDKKQAPR